MNLSSRMRIRGTTSLLEYSNRVFNIIANSVVNQTPRFTLYTNASPDGFPANNIHHLYKDTKILSHLRPSLPPIQFHEKGSDLVFTSTSISLKDVISNLNIKFPEPVLKEFILPTSYERLEKIDHIDHSSLEMPSEQGHHEKHAARLIVIRKRKMKKHKLQKLRKKMKFEWAKVRQRREMRKEKAFQAVLISQIKEAEKFDAAQFVAGQLQKANEIKIPRRWKGKRLPAFIIKEKLGIK